MFGFRLRGYEEMIQEATEEIISDLEEQYEIDWYRVDVDQIAAGSVLVTVYGMGQKYE
jgi:hypothetical protein